MKIKINFRVSVVVVLALCLLATSCAINTAMVPSQAKKKMFINFNNYSPGWYTPEKMEKDWNPLRLKNGDEIIDFKGVINNRVLVAENKVFSGNVLRVFLPKDKFSPEETGMQIYSDIGGYEEVYFGTSVYLPADFECGREIKIPPGIYSGKTFASGGRLVDGIDIGSSVRAVLQNCQAKSYIYHLNQNGDNDDGGRYRNQKYGDKFSWKLKNDQSVIVSKGVKHEIMFYVKMNTPGEKNGIHKVWYDGRLVLSLSNLEFRKVSTLQFDTVGVEIFRGGNNQSYSTSSDNTIDFSDFMVYVVQ